MKTLKTILVTGGLGFIGSHLVERLAALGGKRVEIDVVDNETSAAAPALHFSELGTVVVYAPVPVAEFDTRRRKYDEIYHLASVVGPVGVLKHAGNIAKSILDDTLQLAELARDSGARLVDVSTSETYGGGITRGRDKLSEDDLKVFEARHSARQEYAAGKLAAEIALANSGVNSVVIRPFNVAGPRQRARGGFVIPRFLAQATQGHPLTVYGDGSAVRAFTHVDDIVDGIIAAARRGTSLAYNLGNEANQITILELARKIVATTKSLSGIQHVNPKDLHGDTFAEASDKIPDARRAREELGWCPTRSLDVIIADALAYEMGNRR